MACDWVVTGGADGSWLCRSIGDGPPQRQLKLSDGIVSEARFSASGRRLAFLEAGCPGVWIIKTNSEVPCRRIDLPGIVAERLCFVGERLVVAGVGSDGPRLCLVSAQGRPRGGTPVSQRVRGLAALAGQLVVWSESGPFEPMGEAELYAPSRSGLLVWYAARRFRVPGSRHRVVAGASGGRKMGLVIESMQGGKRALHLVVCAPGLRSTAVHPLPEMQVRDGGIIRAGRRFVVIGQDGAASVVPSESSQGLTLHDEPAWRAASGPWGGLGRLVRFRAGAGPART